MELCYLRLNMPQKVMDWTKENNLHWMETKVFIYWLTNFGGLSLNFP